jgi:hypothetical protein
MENTMKDIYWSPNRVICLSQWFITENMWLWSHDGGYAYGVNPTHGEVYSIQHYVIKFVSDLWQVSGFLYRCTLVSSTNKTDPHNITEILLKVTFNTLKGPSWPWSYGNWIYNFLCNQCLSPVMLHYVIKFVNDLRQVGGSLRVLRFPPPIKLTATI